MLITSLFVVVVVLSYLYRHNQFGLWFLGGVVIFLVLLSLLGTTAEYLIKKFNNYKASLPLKKRALIESFLFSIKTLTLIMIGVFWVKIFQNNKIQAVMFLSVLVLVQAVEKYKNVMSENERKQS